VSHLTTILKQISSSTLSQFADETWPLGCLEHANFQHSSTNPKLARKFLKLLTQVLEYLSESSKLAVCMALLNLSEQLLGFLD
jgi:hypothetical protein